MRSYWDEDLAILSSENVSFSVETAGLGSRLAALALDTFFQLLVLLLVALGAWGAEYLTGFSQNTTPLLYSVLMACFYIFLFLLFFGYYFFFEWLWDGQTPGKRQFGLRVTMNNGLPLSLWPAVIRNVIRVVDFMPFFYGLGSIVAISNSLNQRAGDLFAGTIVVREGKTVKVAKQLTINEAVDAFLKAATTIPGTEARPDALPEAELGLDAARTVDPEAVAMARFITRADYELARDFLARRDTMAPPARQRLGQSLAVRLSAKLNYPYPPADYEGFLSQTVTLLARFYAG
jgi:uncharacterized RDD family membrane protein YckC